MPLPITINGRFLSRPATGVDRFALELLKAWLPRHGADRRATLALPRAALARDAVRARAEALGLTIRSGVDGPLRGHLWEQWRLPALCHDSVLLSLCNSGPVSYRRQIVVLHDAAVVAMPASYSFAYRQWHRWLMTQLLRRAAVVATVSKFSAGELRRCFGVPMPQIEVIGEGGEHVLQEIADPEIFDRLELRGRRFVLAVGSSSPTKNLAALLKVLPLLRELGVCVVAAGGGNRRVFRATGGAPPAGGLVRAGYVSNAELRALYEAAECFVFPSLYEGFGLPPLEAMTCGCPVLVSRRASMPEVCGDAALYFDPNDSGELAGQLRRVLTSRSLRQELGEAGRRHAALHSWSAAAAGFEEIFTRRTAGLV